MVRYFWNVLDSETSSERTESGLQVCFFCFAREAAKPQSLFYLVADYILSAESPKILESYSLIVL